MARAAEYLGCSGGLVDKGTRVTITKGKGTGVSGTIFWVGANKWGPGQRFGIRGDDGETYWAPEPDVEEAGGPAPEVEAGPTFAKGDRVGFKVGEREGTGTVFWTGDSRSGPGQRLGINDDSGEEPVWLDSRFARALGADEPPMVESGVPGVGRDPAVAMPEYDGPAQEPPLPDSEPLASDDEAPPPVPYDDGYFDQLAATVDEDDVPPPEVPPEW